MRAVLGWGVLSLLAAGFVLVELSNVRKNFKATSWPRIEAEVIFSSPKRGCGKGSSYSPLVRYKYAVNETQYVSEVLSYSTFDCGGFEEMKARTDQFSLGQKVAAYVDPTNPSNAVLIAGDFNSDNKLGIALFSVLSFGCAHFARQAWRGRD